PLCCVETVDKKAVQQHTRRRNVLGNQRKKVDRPVRNIAHPIAIQIVAAILAPVVSVEIITVLFGIGDYLKGVADEIISDDLVVETVSFDVHRLTIAYEAAVANVNAVGTFGINPDGVSVKGIAAEFAVRNFFQQQSIGCASPVFFKQVVGHFNFLREHHRNTGTVVFEDVVLVYVVVRKHEMQSVAKVVFAGVARDEAVVNKFKINTVAVSGEGVVGHKNPRAFPDVNGISGAYFIGC